MQPTTTLSRPTTDTAVETVQRFFAAWATGDADTMVALVAPEAVIEPVPGLLYSRPAYHGRDGVAAALTEISGRWDKFEMRIENARHAGDKVFALVHVSYGKHGMSCDVEIPVACTLYDGLIVSVADDGHVR